jgi:hypothetical protein
MKNEFRFDKFYIDKKHKKVIQSMINDYKVINKIPGWIYEESDNAI